MLSAGEPHLGRSLRLQAASPPLSCCYVAVVALPNAAAAAPYLGVFVDYNWVSGSGFPANTRAHACRQRRRQGHPADRDRRQRQFRRVHRPRVYWWNANVPNQQLLPGDTLTASYWRPQSEGCRNGDPGCCRNRGPRRKPRHRDSQGACNRKRACQGGRSGRAYTQTIVWPVGRLSRQHHGSDRAILRSSLPLPSSSCLSTKSSSFSGITRMAAPTDTRPCARP